MTSTIRKLLFVAAGIVLAIGLIRMLQYIPEQGRPFAGPTNTDAMPIPLSAVFMSDMHTTQKPRYGELLAEYEEKGYKSYRGPDIRVSGASYAAAQGEIWTESTPDAVASDGEGGYIEWRIDVPESAMYELEFRYLALPGKQISVERQLWVDGEPPFREASLLVFPRTWQSAPSGQTNNQGNEIRAPQQELYEWRAISFQHPFGLYKSPYKLYLSAGEHTIRLLDTREPLAIEELALKQPAETPAYADVYNSYIENGYAAAASPLIKVQTEYPLHKNNFSMRAIWVDEPKTEPYAIGTIKYNVFDGNGWERGGSSGTWEFDVPEDGLYQIAFRYQTLLHNQVSHRMIEIDGAVPFRELEEYAFPFASGLQTAALKDSSNEPYLFYLTEGRHTLTMTTKVGPLRQTVRRLEDVLLEMGYMSQQFVQVTASFKDATGKLISDRFRDYDMLGHVPQLVERLADIQQIISGEREAIIAANGGLRPSYVSSFMSAVHLLGQLIDDPESIPFKLNEFNTVQNNLASAIATLQQQPLHLDYAAVAPSDAEVPRAASTYGEQLYAAYRKFLLSFNQAPAQIGDAYAEAAEEGPVLDVWVGRGREWVELLKQLIEEDFTPATGIRVNVNTVPAGAEHLLLLSYTAGLAPDVMLAVSAQTPVEFAMRNAVYDLSDFPEADDVFGRFVPDALIPYTYDDNVYAIPETQDFLMMFYRTDIFESLGEQPPQTWRDVYALLPKLQERGMEFYYPDGDRGYAPFLFQQGGRFYTDEGMYSALDSQEGLTAFRQWTEMFVNYGVPLKADFYQRFRTGEMPVGIGNYDIYSRLASGAPELNGRWEMVPIPGTERGDGTIDRSSGGVGQAGVILRSTPHPEAAWDLLKWWTSEDVQARYGLELGGMLGIGSRWNTSNLEAMKSLDWSKKELDAILRQWEWFEEQPVVPGGYYTQRHVLNAWNQTVLTGVNPRIAIEDAVKEINKELERKREELASRLSEAEISGGEAANAD